MENLHVYIDTETNGIPRGTYPVVSTNETYDTKPTVAVINVNSTEVKVPVSKYSWGYQSGGSGQFVYSTDIQKHLDEVDTLSEAEVKENLDGLHHCEYTVEEFIEEFGGGDAKVALKVAIRNDWDAMPVPKKTMDDNFIKAMRNHGRD